ncbi:hypothetical protein EI94DRAFT_1818942 [Lactarius quietus]|nr:hypothetical protein EI94DRAFT_1818942 [Lactarius quietus]
MDFPGRQSAIDSLVGSDFGFAPPAKFCPHHIPPSQSGSSLHSNFDPSTAHLFLCRAHSPSTSTDSLAATLPADIIVVLSDVQLYQNPLHRDLQQKFIELSQTLTQYVQRDLRSGVIPNLYQAQAPQCMDSRASSLGPSDSASQNLSQNQLTLDSVSVQRAVDDLLSHAEAPLMRPDYLPMSVLWDYEDCLNDPLGEAIIMEANKSRLQMSLTICRPNGGKISRQMYTNIRTSANIIMRKLISFADSDPCSIPYGSKPWTKSFIKDVFPAEFHQAVLDLEAEQTILRLCSSHWKAEAMIGQVFLWRTEQGDSESRGPLDHSDVASSNPTGNPFDANMKASQPPKPSHTALAPHVWDVASKNTTKCGYEQSPGPKSPSALQASKCTKDNAKSSGQKTMDPLVLPNHAPAACMIVPSFLNCTEEIRAETAPILHPIYIDPSAKNLIAILTSKFPSFVNAPVLLRSMNAPSLVKQGTTSQNVATLLKHVQSVDPSSPDIDEDDAYQGWGHYQFMAGGLSPSSCLTSWQDIGRVDTAFQLVAAAIKTCEEARLMCTNAGLPKTCGFISNVYLEKIINCLEMLCASCT